MDDLEDNVHIIVERINKLNDFIALSLRRNNISKELVEITMKTIKVRDLLLEAYTQMQNEMQNSEDEYEEIMSQMRKKQNLIMQYLIKEKQRKLKEAEEEKIKTQLVLSCRKATKCNSAIKASTAPKSAIKIMGHNLAKLNLNQGLAITPKIKISEYKDSPMVKKKINPIPVQFVEFDVEITQQQFNRIPKYMCGRETLDQLNVFLENVIIPCFNEKYQLLHKDRSCVRNQNDLELWKLYNEQASSLPGRTFITPGDITRKLEKMLDKKTQNRLIMLRHIGILHEQRVKQTICYIWSCSGHF